MYLHHPDEILDNETIKHDRRYTHTYIILCTHILYIRSTECIMLYSEPFYSILITDSIYILAKNGIFTKKVVTSYIHKCCIKCNTVKPHLVATSLIR